MRTTTIIAVACVAGAAFTGCKKKEAEHTAEPSPKAAPAGDPVAQEPKTAEPPATPPPSPPPVAPPGGKEYCHAAPNFCVTPPEGYTTLPPTAEPELVFESADKYDRFGVRWYDVNFETLEPAVADAKASSASAHKRAVVDEGKTADGKGVTLFLRQEGDDVTVMQAYVLGPPKDATWKGTVIVCNAGEDAFPAYAKHVEVCKTLRVP